MFARWPSLFIQESITACAFAWPRAMFSAARPRTPDLEARSHGVRPSGSVWSKKPRAAMSSLKSWASEASEALAVSGLQPAFARSWLTRASTADRTEESAGAEALRVAGAEVFGAADDFSAAGAVIFPAPGALDDADRDGFVRSAGPEVFEEDEGDPVGDSAFAGPSARPTPRLAGSDAVERSAGEAEEPPWVSGSGAPSVRTRSEPPPTV